MSIKFNLNNQHHTQMLERQVSKLLEDAKQQLAEHKVFLKKEIREYLDKNPNPHYSLLDLLSEVNEIKLEQAKVEEAVKSKKNNKTISIVYDYPEILYQFLTQPFIPATLSITKQKGIALSEVPSKNKA